MTSADRVPALLADIARFARSAARVVSRGHDAFIDPDIDDQRRIARSIIVDLSAAADRLPEEFRAAHPRIDWKGIRAVRNFVAHDYDGTDEEVLWQALAVRMPELVDELGLEPPDAVDPLDLQEVRMSVAAHDADRFLAAVTGRDIDDVLQQLAEGIRMALAVAREDAEPMVLYVISRLNRRADAGDKELADDLSALLRRQEPEGRLLSVDLDELSSMLEEDPGRSLGAYVDLTTGEVYSEQQTDPMMVGEEYAIDVENEPERWLWLHNIGSREGWEDMAAFAERQRDRPLRNRLERAIEGKGAFRRFRELIYSEDLGESWFTFSTDRRMGRARQLLADEGIRVR